MGHMNINIPIMKNKAFPIYVFQPKNHSPQSFQVMVLRNFFELSEM